MSGWLASLFQSSKAGGDGWTQPQREALVDLLVVAMYADGHLSLAESGVLSREAEALAWEGSTDAEEYLAKATERVRALRSTEDGRENLLVYVRERLGTLEDRQRAFAVCESLLASDGRSEAEEAFAENCRRSLGL